MTSRAEMCEAFDGKRKRSFVLLTEMPNVAEEEEWQRVVPLSRKSLCELCFNEPLIATNICRESNLCYGSNRLQIVVLGNCI